MLHHIVVNRPYISIDGILKYYVEDLGYQWDEATREYAAPIHFLDVEAEARRQAEAIRAQWDAVRSLEIENGRTAQPFQPQDHECIDSWGTIRPKLEGMAVSYLPYGLTEATQPNAPEMKLWQPRGKMEMGFKHPREPHCTPFRTTWVQRFSYLCWFDPRKAPNRDFLYSEWVSLLSERPAKQKPKPEMKLWRVSLLSERPVKQKPAEPAPAIRFSAPNYGQRMGLGFFPQREGWYPAKPVGDTITESNGGSAWLSASGLSLSEIRYRWNDTNRISQDQLTFWRNKDLIHAA